MAIKTQVQLLADVEATLGDNTEGAISAADLRTLLTDITDTAEDRWGVGALASSPAVSPSLTEAAARIAGKLADCAGGAEGCVSPEDVRIATQAVLDVFYQDV
jgi:hypothetical protein